MHPFFFVRRFSGIRHCRSFRHRRWIHRSFPYGCRRSSHQNRFVHPSFHHSSHSFHRSFHHWSHPCRLSCRCFLNDPGYRCFPGSGDSRIRRGSRHRIRDRRSIQCDRCSRDRLHRILHVRYCRCRTVIHFRTVSLSASHCCPSRRSRSFRPADSSRAAILIRSGCPCSGRSP